jgi:hypothetical protein
MSMVWEALLMTQDRVSAAVWTSAHQNFYNLGPAEVLGKVNGSPKKVR